MIQLCVNTAICKNIFQRYSIGKVLYVGIHLKSISLEFVLQINCFVFETATIKRDISGGFLGVYRFSMLHNMSHFSAHTLKNLYIMV